MNMYFAAFRNDRMNICDDGSLCHVEVLNEVSALAICSIVPRSH